MLLSEFNSMPLAIKSKLVFSEGKLISIIKEDAGKKGFYYKLNGFNVDVVYDKTRNQLIDIVAR